MVFTKIGCEYVKWPSIESSVLNTVAGAVYAGNFPHICINVNSTMKPNNMDYYYYYYYLKGLVFLIE
jgi:hypothetical protein